MAVIKRNR